MSSGDNGIGEFVWGPTIAAAACTDCGTCIDFCQQGVYEWVDGHVRVARRDACMPGCSHCAALCEAAALTFPTLEELRASRRKG